LTLTKTCLPIGVGVSISDIFKGLLGSVICATFNVEFFRLL